MSGPCDDPGCKTCRPERSYEGMSRAQRRALGQRGPVPPPPAPRPTDTSGRS